MKSISHWVLALSIAGFACGCSEQTKQLGSEAADKSAEAADAMKKSVESAGADAAAKVEGAATDAAAAVEGAATDTAAAVEGAATDAAAAVEAKTTEAVEAVTTPPQP